MSGVDLNTVRELMGHKSIRMTLRYVHLSPAYKKRAVEILGQKWSQNGHNLLLIDSDLENNLQKILKNKENLTMCRGSSGGRARDCMWPSTRVEV